MRIALATVSLLLIVTSASAWAASNNAVQAEAGREFALKQVLEPVLTQTQGTPEHAHWVDIRDRLASAELQTPLDRLDFRKCIREPNTQAYVFYNEPTNIYLCSTVFKKGINAIGQALIHEAEHLTGNRDECQADAVAAKAFGIAGYKLGYKGYNCPGNR